MLYVQNSSPETSCQFLCDVKQCKAWRYANAKCELGELLGTAPYFWEPNGEGITLFLSRSEITTKVSKGLSRFYERRLMFR